MKTNWCLADALALALDEKEANPKADFLTLVNEFWAEMQEENEEMAVQTDETLR